MMDTYEHGYFKALLDLKNYLTDHDEIIKKNTKNSRKKYETLIKTLLSSLLTDIDSREIWMKAGSNCGVLIDPKTCAVVYITDDIREEE